MSTPLTGSSGWKHSDLGTERIIWLCAKARSLGGRDQGARCAVGQNEESASPSALLGAEAAGRFTLWRDRRPAVDDDRLAGNVCASTRGEHQSHAGDVLRLTKAFEQSAGFARCAPLRVLVKHAGKLGRHDAGRDTIDAYVVRAPLGGEIAAQCVIGRFGASVHAEHRAGTQCRRRQRSSGR